MLAFNPFSCHHYPPHCRCYHCRHHLHHSTTITLATPSNPFLINVMAYLLYIQKGVCVVAWSKKGESFTPHLCFVDFKENLGFLFLNLSIHANLRVPGLFHFQSGQRPTEVRGFRKKLACSVWDLRKCFWINERKEIDRENELMNRKNLLGIVSEEKMMGLESQSKIGRVELSFLGQLWCL